MAYRKRSGSGSKKHNLKEKVVLIYETFLKGDDPTVGNPNFWDEFFLLKPKISLLDAEINKMSGDQLNAIQNSIHLMVSQCIAGIAQEHTLRNIIALQTLCALVDGVTRKARTDARVDAVAVLLGKEAADSMRLLLETVNELLTGDPPAGLKTLGLQLLLLLVTAADDLAHNKFLEFAMTHSVFEELVQLLKIPANRVGHGHEVVLLLTLLVSYRKHEASNPYIVKLSILDDELALHGLGQVVTSGLTDACRAFTAHHTDAPAGWLTSITSMVGSMFVSEDGGRSPQLRANNQALLALYEAVHLNRNFVAVLAHAQTDLSPLPSPVPDAPASPTHLPSHPSTLLGTFFQYCSIVMQDTKSEASANIVKLCLLILTCITEDHYANALMHDANLVFHVELHRLPMRHRKLAPDKRAPSQPLASTLHDLLVEFIMSHMVKKLLPLELYFLCVGVVHRLLCYQKRANVRLSYQWKELWTALTTFLKFLVSNEHLTKKMNIFELAIQIVNIFNLFIAYGDAFLPAPSSYDDLYYEIIRMSQVYDDLYAMALRYSTTNGMYREHAMKLTNCLVNIRSIINYFTPKIEQWMATENVSTPSEEQILELVRKNYDNLTLRLQDSLDQFERYAEKPKHIEFFAAAVKSVVVDSRANFSYSSLNPRWAASNIIFYGASPDLVEST